MKKWYESGTEKTKNALFSMVIDAKNRGSTPLRTVFLYNRINKGKTAQSLDFTGFVSGLFFVHSIKIFVKYQYVFKKSGTKVVRDWSIKKTFYTVCELFR